MSSFPALRWDAMCPKPSHGGVTVLRIRKKMKRSITRAHHTVGGCGVAKEEIESLAATVDGMIPTPRRSPTWPSFARKLGPKPDDPSGRSGWAPPTGKHGPGVFMAKGRNDKRWAPAVCCANVWQIWTGRSGAATYSFLASAAAPLRHDARCIRRHLESFWQTRTPYRHTAAIQASTKKRWPKAAGYYPTNLPPEPGNLR